MATPLEERTYGTPPYDESAAIEAARHIGNANRSLRSVLLRAFAGMGSFRQDQPLGANILNVLGGVGRATMAQDQQRSLDEYRAQQQAFEERRLARLEQEKPAKEPKPTVADKIAEIEAALGGPLTPEQKQKIAGVYIPPKMPKQTKAANPPKEPAARLNKLRKEMAAFPHATPDELLQMSTDSTLEPETQQRAMAVLRRYQNPQSPSQVPP